MNDNTLINNATNDHRVTGFLPNKCTYHFPVADRWKIDFSFSINQDKCVMFIISARGENNINSLGRVE